MARSTVLGKRKAQDVASIATTTIETRKRRALRSNTTKPVQVLEEHDDDNDDNDENIPPQEVIVENLGVSPASVLEEDSIRRISDYGDDDTPCRRREKRGRKVFFADAKTRNVTTSKLQLEDKVTEPSQLQLATPKTPRYRDALSSVISTPKHQVRVAGRFPLTPRTPRTPNGSAITVYNAVRQLFARSADNSSLVGRESERATIESFIEDGLRERTGRALYVSGPPGTGKSAFTNSITDGFRASAAATGLRAVYVNCMSVRSSQDLFARLLEELAPESASLSEEDMQRTLKGIFFAKHSPKQQQQQQRPVYLITLDEVDNLLTLNVETLYTLFEWALDKSSNIILVGIANALDLTDRFLPRLKAKNLRPQLLPFIPYTAAQIASVITAKLRSTLPLGAPDNFVPFVQPPAIQLCAKKVASQTGDLRKSFDIIRSAIDLVEADVRAKFAASEAHARQQQQQQTSPSATRVLGENTNLASPKRATAGPMTPPSARSTATALANLTTLTAPRASLAHVSKVTASAFGNGTVSRLKTLNLQQKAALCAVVAHTKRVLACATTAQTTASSAAASSRLGFHAPSPSSSSFSSFSSFSSSSSAPMTAAALRAAQAPTVRTLFAVYVALCRRDGGALAVLSGSEFADVVASLEALGLLVEERDPLATPRKSKGLGVARDDKRVRGCVAERELEAALEGPGGELLKGLLKGE